jgi:Sec-independent protein translocase protein TatA
MDFYDKNRYAKRRFFNNLRDSIWSVILIIIVLVLGALALPYLLRWLNVMWRAARYGVE